jgi:hypothetical protein
VNYKNKKIKLTSKKNNFFFPFNSNFKNFLKFFFFFLPLPLQTFESFGEISKQESSSILNAQVLLLKPTIFNTFCANKECLFIFVGNNLFSNVSSPI